MMTKARFAQFHVGTDSSPLFRAVALLPLLIAASCISGQPEATVSSAASPTTSATTRAVLSPTQVSPSAAGTTLFVLTSEPGSTVGGTVQVDKGSGGTTLTADLVGLKAGQRYLADADPLSCEFFVGGPSQSFPSAFTGDPSGRAKVSWTVPAGMAGNANVQVLTAGGAYAVVACTDLG